MAHVVVLDGDEGIRAAMRDLLADEGHLVTTTSDGTLADAIVATCTHPLVVIVNSRFCALHPHTGAPELALWRMAARSIADSAGGAPRRFIVMTTNVSRLGVAQQALLASLAVPILAQPFDLNELLLLVVRAERELECDDVSMQRDDMEWGMECDTGQLERVEVTHGRDRGRSQERSRRGARVAGPALSAHVL